MPSKIIQHPLVSKLKFKDEIHTEIILNGIGSVINKKALRKIFSRFLRKGDIDNLKTMLRFNYSVLSNFEPDSLFYLEKSPFNRTFYILDKIQEANSLGLEEISLLIQKHVEPWLLKNLSIENDLLSRKVSNTICAVVYYQPMLAYHRLSLDLKSSIDLSEAVCNSKSYDDILKSLYELAKTPIFFDFAATKLWQFATKEIILNEHGKSDKALPLFANLFKICSDALYPLKDRMGYLSRNIHSAKYWPRKHVLIKTLSKAADISSLLDEAKDTQDPDLQAYVNFSIDMLMKYATLKDDDYLSSYAQDKIHHLLGTTIDKLNIYSPHRIFRHYLHARQQWKNCPFSHIDNFESKINELKISCLADFDDINLLERRLSQLNSFRGNDYREFIANDFRLVIKAKKQSKTCEIGLDVDQNTNLELHERQSLAERLFFAKTINLRDIGRLNPRCTYIVVNFGMVISSEPHQEGGKHGRIFKTIPIKIPNDAGINMVGSEQGHAEQALYKYLLKKENINYYLGIFKQKFQINNNHKIYAVIFDLHGTYDMCLSCAEKGFEFQEKFRKKILQLFPQQKFITLTKYSSQLPITIRYSSDLKYHYSNNLGKDKQGVLSVIATERNSRRDLSQSSSGSDEVIFQRDIKQFTPNLLLHGKDNWHSLWPRKNPSIDIKCLESWSAFVSSYEYNRNLSVAHKKFDYVEQTINDELSSGMSKLSVRQRR